MAADKPLVHQGAAWRLRVAIDAPLAANFDYLAPPDTSPTDIGLRVVVPFGSGRRVGLIMAVLSLEGTADPDAPCIEQLKAAEAILRDLPPLPTDWVNLCLFAASYYQAAPGEALLQAIPTGLRKPDPTKRRALKHPETIVGRVDARPVLTVGQAAVVH